MPAPGRHIEGVRPETPVQELAYAAIVQRLEAVTTQFPLAAEGAIDDNEPVHQLRVATRRAVAALELFQEFCPPRRAKKLLRILKRIRRAAGRARDLDVFMAQLATSSDGAHSDLLQTLSDQRQATQKEIVELYKQLGPTDRLAACIQSLTDRIRPRGKKAKKCSRQPLVDWAPLRFRKATMAFVKAVPKSLDGPERLHPLRIEGKRLRYTLELLASGHPASTYEELYLRLEEHQDRLGAINDHQVAIDRLTTHNPEAHHLIESERTAMQEAVEQFTPWFHESFLPRLLAVVQNHKDPVANADADMESE